MEDRDIRIEKAGWQQEPEDYGAAAEAGRYIMVPVAELARLYRPEGRIAALMDFIPDDGEVDREVAELILLGKSPSAGRYERYDA